MQIDWLEDFIALAKAGSFSSAAQARRITQSALSRRIQSLEAWAETGLVDRSCLPLRLTQAGQALLADARRITALREAMRHGLHSHAVDELQSDIRVAVPHVLTPSLFLRWLNALRVVGDDPQANLTALHVHDAMPRFAKGDCDLLITAHPKGWPPLLCPTRHERLQLGNERLLPYARANAHGHPVHELQGDADVQIPHLAYSNQHGLSDVVQGLLQEQARPARLQKVFEADLIDSIKAMALAGQGIAFLPESAARDEVQEGRLVLAGNERGAMLDIFIYRHASQGTGLSERIQMLWNRLLAWRKTGLPFA